MDERAMVAAIRGLIEEIFDGPMMGLENDPQHEPFYKCDIRTFEEGGVLTDNEGFVLKMADGSEFQISVVQSKRAS